MSREKHCAYLGHKLVTVSIKLTLPELLLKEEGVGTATAALAELRG